MNDGTNKGTAVITGASSGIGAIYADRLARDGYDLILIARNIDQLQNMAKKITDQSGRSVEVLSADLTDKADMARIEQALKMDASITLLVNNAGVGATAQLIDSSIDDMDAMIAINVNALTHLTRALAPGFVERGTGTFINISSIVAIAPELLNGVYGGTKAYVLAFSQSLHHELGSKGVRVQVVLPGATATRFWDLAGLPIEHLPKGIVMPAEDMVDAALAGLAMGELVTIPSLPHTADWDAFDAARKALGPQLSATIPAERFRSPRPDA